MNEIEMIYWEAMRRLCAGGIESSFQNDSITCSIVESNIASNIDLPITAKMLIISNKTDTKDYILSIKVTPQQKMGRYIVDFLVIIAGIKGIPALGFVVEIDGHDFHEKTKAQVRYDKERERYLISSGAIVIRYTGSEVFCDSNNSAYDTINTIMDFVTNIWGFEDV